MTRKFNELRTKRSPESQERAKAKTKVVLSEMEWDAVKRILALAERLDDGQEIRMPVEVFKAVLAVHQPYIPLHIPLRGCHCGACVDYYRTHLMCL